MKKNLNAIFIIVIVVGGAFLGGILPRTSFLFWPLINYPMFSSLPKNGSDVIYKLLAYDDNGQSFDTYMKVSYAPYGYEQFLNVLKLKLEEKSPESAQQFLKKYIKIWNKSGLRINRLDLYMFELDENANVKNKTILLELDGYEHAE